MKLETKYRAGAAGCRLDLPGDADNTGPAIDIVDSNAERIQIWMRGEDGQTVILPLSIENVWELREHFNYLLETAGLERKTTIQVPT